MTPDRWQTIQRIYHDALKHRPKSRCIFVQKTCHNDPALADEVIDLLNARTDDTPLVDNALVANAADVVATVAHQSRDGQHVGPYKIIRETGRGGMATVYLAERDDEQFDHQVAVKIVKKGMDSDQILDRFKKERQTLANLNHPNIAKLLDGGTTDDHMPYLVMEHIAGLPIDEYCERNDLSLADRLALLQKVCAAAHYAHQNLTIHRDLKPSNILVTNDGTPKLLDFGIAKILEDDPTETHITQTAQRFMTPDYAAPEQILGQPITTSTDVYALGVIAYQLLTGQRPFQRSTLSQHELELAIIESDPPRPSDTTQPSNPKLRKALRGDLDNIILKALRKEPDRRYATADQFAEDIIRHLAGLPVSAHKGTVRYRTAKFLRRNKVTMTATAAVFLSLVIGIAATYNQAVRARSSEAEARRLALAETQAKNIAQQQAEKASRISDFLKRLLISPDPYRYGKNYRILDLLETASEWIDEETAQMPEVGAELHVAIGIVYRGLGEYTKATEHLEKSRDIRTDLFGSESLEVADTLHNLADLAYRERQYDRAGKLFRIALDVREKQLPADDLDLMATRQGLAGIYFMNKEYRQAEEMFRRVLRNKDMIDEDHAGYARTVNNLATTIREQGRYDEADPLYQEALRVRLETNGPDHYNVAVSYANIATLRALQKQYEEATENYTRAIDIMETQLDPDHPTIAIVLTKFGDALIKAKDFAAAAPVLERAVDIETKNFPDGTPQTADLICILAEVYDKLNRPDDAAIQYQNALNLRTQLLGSDHPDTREIQLILADR